MSASQYEGGGRSLHLLEEDRDALAASDTGRAYAVLLSLPPEFVYEVGRYPGSGGR